MEVGFGGGKGSEEQSTQVTMPDWLRPFVSQSTGAASGALGSLQGLAQQDTVANLTPDQLQAMEMMRGYAGGAGGFLPTAQNTFMQAAQGMGTNFLDPALQQRLSGAGFDMADYIGQGRDATAFTGTPGAREALDATARGDYLFGGEGFDAAVDAAVRAAQPQIMSTFGRAGAGGSTSGLAQAAVGQSAIDAFANQYGQERGRQVGAAQALEQGGRADRSQFLNYGNQGAARAFGGDQMLAGLSGQERQNQMMAAGQLPGIGMLDSQTMMNVGDIMQGQQQRELSGPIQNQLMLLQAALAGPGAFGNYLGADQQGDYSKFNWGLGFDGLGGT